MNEGINKSEEKRLQQQIRLSRRVEKERSRRSLRSTAALVSLVLLCGKNIRSVVAKEKSKKKLS